MPNVINKENILCINHEELIKIVKRVYKTKLSAFVLGKIGIGKSDTVRQAGRELAEEYGIKFNETKTTDIFMNNRTSRKSLFWPVTIRP